ncbi:NAD(P)-binding protein [Sporormia fimetaria CBS 119925]|uniref:NAD(P)-binding protein n=1 Tax=Sporormia fimetaria CBS 119925 TaxID=1340428 RepID=A0A6A6VK71_9PLEO|nr:NAD(P)-binding protein [Sporormia fimetaria CBS 119925]
MTSFTIPDSNLDAIKDKVVIVTGAASGIGLATVKRVLQHGGKVFASDVNDMPEPEKSQVSFMNVDVTSWKEQLDMFKAAQEKFGKIHHVFANAVGIGPTCTLLENEVDENGDLLPPRLKTFDVNLTGVVYTVKLGIHYIQKHSEGGSIVMTATSKHAVLGLLRSLYVNLHPNLPIRINAIGPSWTETGIVPKEVIEALGRDAVQSPDVVARSVVNLMAGTAHGEFIYSDRGKFWDIENGDKGLNAYAWKMIGSEYTEENAVVEKLQQMAKAAKDAVTGATQPAQATG